MNLERAAMKGRLAEAEQTRNRLRLKITGTARQFCQSLNTVLTPVEELEIPLLDEQWDDLKRDWSDLIVALDMIKRLQRELS